MRAARGTAVAASVFAIALLVGVAAFVGSAASSAELGSRAALGDSAGAAVTLPLVTRVPRTPALARPASATAQSGDENDPSGAYLSWLDRTLISVDDATWMLLELVMTPDHDASWSMQVTGTVSVWTSAYHNAMSRQPPLVYTRQHAAVVQGFSQYNVAAAVVLQGANEGNERLVASGIDQAFAGRTAVSQALAAMRSGG